ncbi:MAG: alcohol dehydrogenase catalytic domain-containing protein [Pseudomonadota bacterium]|jgi:2-desacetyl-2-hydroxyethyl bacteriochlorophyllide A dehydrogenase
MRAALVKDIKNITVEEIEKPQAKEGEALLRIQMAGICGSDHSIYKGKMPASLPLVPGHEGVGTVEALGPAVKKIKVGQRVTIHPNYFCGKCLPCSKGLTNVCLNKTRLGIDINGVFAEYVAVPEKALYPVPDSLSSEMAVFTEPLAVAVHGINLVPPRENERVLIFGAGVIGQLSLQLALQTNTDITACDLIETRLELARRMGAKKTIGDGESLEDWESSFDVIYETSGAPAALDIAVRLAAQGGRIALLGIPGEDHSVPTVQIVRKELQIFGSMIYTDEFTQSLEILREGLIKTEPLMSGIIPLERLGETLENFDMPSRMKTLVKVKT